MEDYTCEGCACENDKEQVKQHMHIAFKVFAYSAILGLICGSLSSLLLIWVMK